MVVRITGGSSLYGALKYNDDKEKSHSGQVLFTNEITASRDGGTMTEWLAGFQPYLDANRNTRKPIIHISLNPHPDDKLNREEYVNLATDYMQRMGYGYQPYVVFLHEDIDRKHIHIVSTRVDANGEKLKHSFERRRSNEIRLALEKEYGLKPAAYREGTALPPKKIDYKRGNIGAQTGSIVISALEQYRFSTFGEFNALLRCYNLAAWEVNGTAGKDNKPYRGLMYGALDDEGNRVGNSIKSSRIWDHTGLPEIEKKCAENMEYLKDLDRRKALAGRIRRVVAECVRRGEASRPEIERRLLEVGISAVFRHNDDGRLTGATFVDHRGKNVYNGSNLGKDLSANAWYALFSKQRQQERPSHGSVEPERTTTRPQPSVETLEVAETQTHAPTAAPEPAAEILDDDYYEDLDPVLRDDSFADDDRGTSYRPGHDIFGGRSRPGSTHEEIDPEFRSLYKRKKKKGRKL